MAVLVCIAFGVLFYTYVGYPILLWVLARLHPLRMRDDESWQPSVSVCIPVYNGSTRIERKLRNVLALDYPAHKLEVLIYDDASTDRTAEIVGAMANQTDRIRLLRAKGRRGKPAGLNLMRQAARGNVLLLTDLRQDLSRNALRDMLTMLADPRVGCVSGRLQLDGTTGPGLYWRYECWIRTQEAAFRGVVGVTGSIYVIRRRDLPQVPDDTLLDDQWIPMRLRLAGRRIRMCPSAIAVDEAFGDGREFSRKVRTLAGNYQLFSRLPGLLLPGINPSFLETFSHKVLRLVCPYLLAVAFVCSVWLGTVRSGGTPTRAAVFQFFAAMQGAGYLAALLGPRVGGLGRAARSFVVLNAAAVVGLWRYARGSQRVTW